MSVLAVSGLAASLAACVADTSNPLAPGADAGPFEFDGSQHPFDGATGHDASPSQPDAEVDSTVPEDSPATDTSVPEDTNVVDTGTDASVDDAGNDVVVVIDAGADSGTDSGIDAGHDAGVDATVDSGVDSGPVDAGPPNCAVKLFGDYYTRTDGTVVYMQGSQNVVMDSTTSQPLKTVVAVAPQDNHACALLANGTVWCWASNSNGNVDGDLGNGTLGGTPVNFSATQVVTQPADAGAAYLTNVIAIEEGSNTYYTHPTCVIRSDHTVWCWGVSGANGGAPSGMFWGTTGSVNSVPYAFPIASGPAPGDGGAQPLIFADKVAVGNDSLCYVSGGQVECLGGDIAGNLGDDNTDSNSTGNFKAYPVSVLATNGFPATITDIASGYRFTCALGSGGVWCWGGDALAGDPGSPKQICNSNYCQPVPVPVQVALQDGGATSFPDAGVDQSPLTNVTALQSTYQASCALDGSGNLRCWGYFVGGSTLQPEASLYLYGGVPATNVTQFSLSPEVGDINGGVRFLTQSGVLVSKQTVINQICP